MGSEVMTKMKAGIAMLAAGLMLGAATVATAQGHGMGQMRPGMMGQMQGMGQSGPMMGPGMMASGQMAPGMMGPGMMGPGMTGQMPQGMMGGRGPMAGLRIMPTMHLTTDDVRHHLEHYLEQHEFQHLQVGEVQQTSDDTITADIVTREGSLALQLEIDPHTGLVKKFG
jgi:hypothetical protein